MFFIAACSPLALIEHEPTLYWGPALGSRCALVNTLHGWKNVIFLIDLIFDWICWFIEKTRLLVWLFKALDPLCAILLLSEIFSNFWIFEYFQLNYRHCIHSSYSSDIVGLIARLVSFVSQLFQYPMWLHGCNQAIFSLSILSKLPPVADDDVLKFNTSSVSILFCWKFLK